MSNPPPPTHNSQEDSKPAAFKPPTNPGDYLRAQHRAAFNFEAFQIDPSKEKTSPVIRRSSKALSQKDYDARVNLIKKWGPPKTKDPVHLKFRQANRQGYRWMQTYCLETSEERGDVLYHRDKPDKAGKLGKTRALVFSDVFDAIAEQHEGEGGHLKVFRTWSKVHKLYGNITEDNVKSFIKYCSCRI